MKVHVKKTIDPHYGDIVSGEKTAEIRKNDCSYNVGDYLILAFWKTEDEVDPWGGFQVRRITHICDYEQKEGFVVLSINQPELSPREMEFCRAIYHKHKAYEAVKNWRQ